MDQKNSGLNLAPSFMEGKGMVKFYHIFENSLPWQTSSSKTLQQILQFCFFLLLFCSFQYLLSLRKVCSYKQLYLSFFKRETIAMVTKIWKKESVLISNALIIHLVTIMETAQKREQHVIVPQALTGQTVQQILQVNNHVLISQIN